MKDINSIFHAYSQMRHRIRLKTTSSSLDVGAVMNIDMLANITQTGIRLKESISL